MSRIIRILGLACLLAFGSAWAAAPMPVVTSFSILADVTRAIGGERVSVQPLIAADTDAHSYQMTPGDVRKIRSAKLLLVIEAEAIPGHALHEPPIDVHGLGLQGTIRPGRTNAAWPCGA